MLILFLKLKDFHYFPQDGPKHEFRKMENWSLWQLNHEVFEYVLFSFSDTKVSQTEIEWTLLFLRLRAFRKSKMIVLHGKESHRRMVN